MKITYIHQYFNLPSGTSSTRSYEMARRLCIRGHEVHIVSSERTASASESGWHVQVIDGIFVHTVPVPYNNSMNLRDRMRAFAKFAVHAAQRARYINGDIVLATSTPLTVAIPAWYANLFRPTPQVFEVRDLWPEVPIALGALRNPLLRRSAFALQRFAYRNASHVVALSPGMKEGVVAAGYPADRVTVIPNSSDLAVFDVPESVGRSYRMQHPEFGPGPLIVYTGTIGTANNVGYIVELASRSRASGYQYRFVVVGRGREADRVRTFAQERGVLNDNFFMVEPVPKDQLAGLLSAATLTISSLLNDAILGSSSPNKFFDSLAAGRPIAINYEGWLADLLRRTGAGIVLDADDPAASIARIAQLVEDPNALAAARQAARDLAIAQFHRDLHGRQLGELLERIIATPNKGRRGYRMRSRTIAVERDGG